MFFSSLHGTFIFLIEIRRPNSKGGVRIIPVDSGMGVEDWESKYKVPDSGVLDDYLDTEQKMWEDEDKSIIYRISDSPCESKGSRFYQTVECDALSPEDTEDPNGRPPRQRTSFGSGEVRLVYKEAGSFEDETSPPEIDIIPSVKQLRKQTDREDLLYKTRLWAKTALEDTLESYAAFREEEAAREEAARIRGSNGSVGSDEMQYSFGSEEELDELTFTEGDTSYEYENYYYPGKYMSPFGGQAYTIKGRAGCGQDPMLSPLEEPSDEYIDPMDELKSLVHSVSEYLAVKEEEINNYESMPKPVRRKLPPLPTDIKLVQPEPGDSNSKDVKPEVKEDSAVEQGIAGVKNAMSSLFSTITGSKSTTEVEASGTAQSPQPPQTDSSMSKLFSLIPKVSTEHTETSGTTATDPPTSQSSPQPESSISKLLSFIPKSGGTSPPVAIVPPASQEPITEKKFSLQSLFLSSEPNPQTDTNQISTHVGTEAQGSAPTANQSTSGFESMLGRLSPLRLFSSAPPSRVPSPQPSEERSASAASNESQQELVNISISPNRDNIQTDRQLSDEMRPGSGSGSVDILSEAGSGSIELSHETGSGSVELLPETESSGELPDIQQRRSPISESKPESISEETGFFSPFKKSLSNLISTVPPETSSHTDTKPAEESFLGSKLKIPFVSSENISSTPPKAEGSMLSGILKFASGEDASVLPKSPSPSPTRTPSPSRAALLESVPKSNTETGWFSNLFKVAPNEEAKQPAKPKMPPTVTLTKPSGQSEPHTEEMVPETTESTVCRKKLPQEQIMSEIDPQCKTDSDQPEADVTSKNQSLSNPVEQARSKPQSQGILSGLLKLGSTEDVSSGKKAQGGDNHFQQGGGIFSGLFSSPSQSSPQTQQNSAMQQSSGLLSGFVKLASHNDSGSANQSPSALPGDQSDQIPQTQGQPAVAQPHSGGYLSGLLKKATDTVTGSQARQSSQESQPDMADHTVESEGLEQNLSKRSTPSTQPAGILSGLIKFGSTEAPPPDKDQSDQQLRQHTASDHQSKQRQTTDQTTEKLPPKATAATPQPSGLFGGLLKLTETATQPPKGSLATQPNQQPGSMLSGLFNKIVEPNPSTSQQQSEPVAQGTNQKPVQQASPQQGGFFSGLFGIGGQDSAPVNPAQVSQNQKHSGQSGQQHNQQQGNKQNLQRQNEVPPQQPPSGPGGMLTGLLNKTADAGTPQSTVANQPEQQQQQPSQQGGFLSGLFSTGPTHPTQQQPPVNHPNQNQPQSNRQPLRRQNQIPPQPATPAPEPQQGGLLSGLFNKLASADNAPPQPTPQTESHQQSSQPSQQGGFLSGLFGQTSHQQQQQQPGKLANSQQSTTQQPSQSGGLLSGILKLASGENVPQEQQSSQPSQTDQPSVTSGQSPAQSESGGLFSGLLNKISGTAEQSSSPDDQVNLQTTKHQQQSRAGQGRPQIQRTKPVEMHSSQDGTDKDLKTPAQKGFFSGLFSVTEEPSSKAQQPSTPQLEKEEQKISTSGTSSLLSSIFKTGPSISNTSTLGNGSEEGHLDHLLPKGKEDIPSSAAVVDTSKEPLQSQIWKEPTISPTQRYLEEIQHLLYGTEGEYGYKDLLYNFTEHGIIQPELYEHQCLIEALLWQQLNDYALAEALVTQLPEQYQPCQGHREPTVRAPQWENHKCLNPKEMDISNFNVPSHPWKDPTAQLFESRNRFLEPNEDLVLFDMSCREKKGWSSCDHLNDLDRNRKPWIVGCSVLNLSMEKPKTRLSRCQSLTECSVQEFSKVMEKCGVSSELKDEDFGLKSATEFLKRLATKKGPMDLTRGAMDLSRSAGAPGDLDDEMLFEDSEWYQQWLSLLEQGLWWPAEAGDCGYYVYTDVDYIYSLLTDRAGRHLYACAAPKDVQALGNITENIANILKQKEKDKVTLCGFKIPLCTEDKVLWIPGQQQNKSVLSDAPMDLTAALRKGEKIMNMNLESFSQMFQESISSQAEQPVDFTMYKLKKVKVESVQNTYTCEEEPMEATDLTLMSLKGGHGGPYWKNKGIEEVLTPSPAPSPLCFSTQISPNKCYSIPEIRIAHVDETPADQPRQRSCSMFSSISGITEASKAETLSSSAPATSPPLSSRVLETSKISRNLPDTPSSSKIPGPIQVGRKLPTPPNISKGDSSSDLSAQQTTVRNLPPTKFTSTVTTLSPHRTRLARQPTQTDEPRVLSQTKNTTIDISKVSSTIAVNQTSSVSQKQAEDSSKKSTPQLHILNDASVTHNEDYLYKRNHNLGTTIGTQIANKVLDFSLAINKNKNIKEKDETDANIESAQKDEVVDFTKYKLKRLKEKQQMDTNVDLIDKTTIAVDLTKETEEDEAEWPYSENPTMGPLQESKGLSVLRTISQTNFRPDDQHSKSERRLPSPQSVTTETNQNDVTASGKDVRNISFKPSVILSGRLSTSSDSTVMLSTAPSPSIAHISSRAPSLDGGLKQTAKSGSLQPLQTSPLVSPAKKKEVEPQGQGLHMQQSPPVVTACFRQQVPVDNTREIFTSPSCQSSGKAQQCQETAPANAVKGTLDMSAKTTTQQIQQTVVPSKDPVCEALSLTKRKLFISEEADTSPSHHDSIDLSYRGESPEPQVQTAEYIHLKYVEEHQSHIIMGNQVKCYDEEIPSGSRRALLPRQHPLLGQSSESLEICKPPQQVTAPANTVKGALDMTSKCPGNLKEAVPEVETSDTQTEAIPLMRGKPSARELARKNSVGLPLVVDIPSQAPLQDINISSPAQGSENISQCYTDSFPHQQLQQSKPGIFAQSNHLTSSTTVNTYQTSITQPYLLSTAPANSIKGTLDMSTKVCNSNTVPNYSDPVSLVRARPSSFAYSQRDSVGVPLIVETHPSQEQPKRQQILVGWQKQMQQEFVHIESREVNQRVSAPANTIKSFLDMSPKPHQKHTEKASDIFSTEAVPLVKNKSIVTRNGSVGVPLVVEQSVHQQVRQTLSGVNTTETLHKQISTYHRNKVLSGSGSIYKETHQQNKPVDFSAKDNLNPTYISSNFTESEDGQPMNFINNKAKKEMFERRQSGRQLEKKTSLGIADLTVDPQNKATIISHQDAKDLSSPYVSSVSQNSLYWQQQYILAPTSEDVRENTVISQTHKSVQYKENSTDEQAAIQHGINYRMQSGTGLNSAPYTSASPSMPLQIQPPQNFASQPMQDSTSLNNAYQQISNVHAEFKRPDNFLPNTTRLQTQHSVSQRQYQQPGVEIGWTSSIAGSQPKPLNLQRQDTVVQHEKTPRPKILIKQPTVDSYGSIEESPSESGTMTSNAQSLPTFSTNELDDKTQTVPTPQSLNVQSLSPSLIIQQAHGKHRTDSSPQCLGTQIAQNSTVTDYYANKTIQPLKQPNPNQSPVTVKQYPVSTVPSGNLASVQCVSEVNALISQPTTKHTTMPVKQVENSYLNQDFGAEVRGPEISSTPSVSTSVKGLISLFSGLDSQPSVSPKPVAVTLHQTQIVSQSVDNKMQITPTQTPVIAVNVKGTTAVSPVGKIPEINDLNLHTPVSSSLPGTPAVLSHKDDSACKLPYEDIEVLNMQSLLKSRAIQTKSFTDSTPVTTESEIDASLPGLQTDLVTAPSLITESILSDVSPQTSPMISHVTTPSIGLPTYVFKSTSISQYYQQSDAMLNSSLAKETQSKELPPSESSPAKPSETMPPKEKLNKGSSIDLYETLTEFVSEAVTKVATTGNVAISESDMPQQESPEETKQTTSTESVNVNTGFSEASSVAQISLEKISHPKSIYIGINCSELPPVDSEIEGGDPKPYVRLPHIFVSAASSPEEETTGHELNECIESEFPEFSASEDTPPIAVTAADCKEALPTDVVVQSDISKDARSTEITSTGAFIESKQVKTFSPDMSLTTADYTHTDEHASQHTLTRKSTTTEAILSESEVKPETTEACRPTLELSSTDKESTALDITPHELVKPAGDLACQVEITNLVVAPPEGPGTLEVLAHKITSSDVVLLEEVQSLDKLSLKEVSSASDVKSPEGVQQLHDKTERSPQPSSVEPPTEEITASKEDILAVKVDQPEVEQTHEQPGKGLFSMFSGSTETPQQTSSQTGLSMLGGILPGSSTKDTPGAGLLSMFGGSNTPSSSGSKDPPLQSIPHEPQGKGLFSMFGGSSSQPPSGPRGPTVGNVRPRGPPPKESSGKGLFSMFGASAPQQPPSPQGHPGSNATPRGPTTGSSIFGGILPGSTTQKATSAAGLFSKFGGLSAQPQTGPRIPTPGPTVTPPGPRASEPSGKGLFSMFGGQNQQGSEAHPAASKPPESEGIFKVSSVFSLGGTSDDNKSKTVFGLFGKSFLEETKTEPEITVPVKEETTLEQVKPPDTRDVSEDTKDHLVDANENVPSEPVSELPVKANLQVDQACHGQDSGIENSVALTEPHLDVEEATMQQHLSSDESASVAIEASITDMPNVTSNLLEKGTLLDEQAVKLVSEVQSDTKNIVDAEKDVSESAMDTFEIKSTGDETVITAITGPSEKTDVMQMPESVIDYTDKNTRSKDVVQVEHMEYKAVAEGDMSIPEVEKQTEEPLKAVSNVENLTEEPLKVVDKEQTTVADMEKSTEEPLKVAEEKQTAVADVEKLTKEPLKVVDGEQADVVKSTEEPLEVVYKEQTTATDIEKSTEEPLEVADEEQTAVADVEKLTKESLKVGDGEQADVEKSTDKATVVDLTIAVTEKPTAESVVGPVSESEKSVLDKTTKERTEAKLGEIGETRTEPVHVLEKSFESDKSVAVDSVIDEEKTVGTNPPEVMPSPPVEPLKGLSLGPASPPPQQQPMPGMVRVPGPPGQRMGMPRMGGPRMGGPRMGGPRMAGPRQPGPQKPPDTAPFSGFISMFSTPNAPSKTPNVGGFFSSSPGSLFGSSPASRQPQQQQQQKSSFFGLPSSIATESLTSDLFGIFKGSETTKSGEPQQSGTESRQVDPFITAPVSESTEKIDTERTPLSGDGHVKSTDHSKVPEKGLVEEAEQTDKTEEEESCLTESSTKTVFIEEEAGNDELAQHLEAQGSVMSDKDKPPSAPETKGPFVIPGLTAPKFGFMSVATDGTSSIGSLFSTTSSSSTGAKTQQPQQVDGGLLSGLKTLSAGIFQDEKPTGNEGTSSASSVFGMKLGSVFGNSDSSKPQSTPPVVTAQPQTQSPKPTDEFCEPELEKLSPGSGETESADVSDTEGPTETSKTGSCETLAQSVQPGLPSHSDSLAEGLDKPQLKITPCEVDKSGVDTPDTVHADLGTEQLKDLVTKEAAKRLVQLMINGNVHLSY